MTGTPVLTPEDHEHFIEHGYVVLKGAIAPDVVRQARETLEKGSADYESVGAATVKACVSPAVHQALAELFGEHYDFHRHQDIVSMPRPLTPEAAMEAPEDEPVSQGGGHLDEDKPTIMPHTWALETWVFLTPVRHRGGAFMFAAGSPNLLRSVMMRGYRAPIAGWMTDPLFQAAAGDLPATIDVRQFFAEPGDVLIYPHLMAHCGSTNVADPLTRQAVLARFMPRRRIVPGDRPFDQMSTVEKINSAGYLRERFGAERFPVPDLVEDETGTTVLADGLGADLVAQAPLRFGGRTHVFAVTRGANEVTRMSTRNWRDWSNEETLSFPGQVLDVALLHHFPGLLMAATVRTPSGIRTMLRRSDDLSQWKDLPEPKITAESVQPYYLTLADSRAAQGNLLLFTDRRDPSRVQFVVGEDAYGLDWDEVADWTWRGVAADCRDADVVDGFAIEPVEGERLHGLVVCGRKEGRRGLWWSVSADSAAFETFAELPSTESGVYGLRVYDRAQKYWLVSYLREHEGSGRLHWGVIDWAEEQPRLVELTSPADLRGAFYVVGLA